VTHGNIWSTKTCSAVYISKIPKYPFALSDDKGGERRCDERLVKAEVTSIIGLGLVSLSHRGECKGVNLLPGARQRP